MILLFVWSVACILIGAIGHHHDLKRQGRLDFKREKRKFGEPHLTLDFENLKYSDEAALEIYNIAKKAQQDIHEVFINQKLV